MGKWWQLIALNMGKNLDLHSNNYVRGEITF